MSRGESLALLENLTGKYKNQGYGFRFQEKYLSKAWECRDQMKANMENRICSSNVSGF